MDKLTKLDIEMILDEKPYDIHTAIEYADKLTMTYNKLYCVVRDVSLKRRTRRYNRVYHIVAFNHYRNNIPIYNLFYITKLHTINGTIRK